MVAQSETGPCPYRGHGPTLLRRLRAMRQSINLQARPHNLIFVSASRSFSLFTRYSESYFTRCLGTFVKPMTQISHFPSVTAYC